MHSLAHLSRSRVQCLNIEKAVFAKNMITTLPKELGHMARLQYLDVSYNQLSGLPETLALLEQLQCVITLTHSDVSPRNY